jgi:hypothetical protein
LRIALLDWACLLSPWTAVFLPNVAVFRIRRPILTYRKIMMVMGMRKKNRNDDSKRNLGVGEMVQKADSGIVYGRKEKI